MNAYNWFCVVTALCAARVGNSKKSTRIVFPEPDEAQQSPVPKELPLNLAMRMSEISDVSDLLENFVDPNSRPNGGQVVVSARFGGVERKALKTAKMATCMPEDKTVSLKPVDDPYTFYYPSCTRLKRCGGCCNHDLLSCQAVESEILQMKVIVTEYRGGSRLSYKGEDIVSVEQHKKCKCDCKVKESDCNPYQKYHKDSCKCVCVNHEKEAKCNEDPRKLWNPNDCTCVCRDALDCSTGFYFDSFQCECVQERRRNNSAAIDDFAAINYQVN